MYSGFSIDLYCAPTAIGTGDGSSESNAMALETALGLTHTPGTNLGALPGNYERSSTLSGLEPVWQLTSDGSAGHPVRVVAKYSAVQIADPTSDPNASRLRHTGNTLGSAAVMVGGYEKEYQEWWGFLADENHGLAGTDAAVAHWRACSGCAFQGMRIIAVTADPGLGSDNHSGIGIRNCQNISITNNRISGFNHHTSHNHNGMVRYDSIGLTIKNNDIFNCSTGIYLKDSPPPEAGGQNEAVGLNRIQGCRTGIEVACANNNSPDYSDVYQNIITDCLAGIAVTNNTTRVRVLNNTIVLDTDDFGEGGCLVMNFAGTSTVCRDNVLVQRGGQTVNNQRYRTAAAVDCDYNRYYSTASYQYRYDGSTRTSLTDWQLLTATDANSTQGDPEFVNMSADDFHLASGSPCLTASSTSGPVGAYISGSETIGVEPETATDYSGFTIDLYCAPTSTGTGDGSSEANAMALASALLMSHAAGIVLGALPGNYLKATTSSGLHPVWELSSDGSPGQPIRVVAKHSAVHMADPTVDTRASRLQHTGNTLPTAAVMVGGYEKEYQEWWGFLADEDTGLAGEDAAIAHWRSSTSCSFNCMAISAATIDPGFSSDAHSGIGVRDCQNITLRNNRISGFNHHNSHNHSGIIRYNTLGFIIENNEISHCSAGLFLKGNPPPATGGQNESVTRNRIAHCRIGIEVASTNNTGTDSSSISQNIITECLTGITVTNDTSRVRVVNNTVVLRVDDAGEGGCVVMNFAGSTTLCQDNIFVQDGGQTVNNQRYRTLPPVDCDYNRYYSTSGYQYRYDGSARTSLLDWQILTTTDSNSTEGDPEFVNPSAMDFHLSNVSPCLTASSVSGPVGAYISGTEIIGIDPM